MANAVHGRFPADDSTKTVQPAGFHPVLAESVQKNQHGRSEIVDLGQVNVLDRIAGRQGVQAELVGESSQILHVIGTRSDVNPSPACCQQCMSRLNLAGAFASIELQGSNEHPQNAPTPDTKAG